MTQYRKDPLQNNQVYHIYSRSISKYTIFNDKKEFNRMCQLINFYRYRDFSYKLSQFNDLSATMQKQVIGDLKINKDLFAEVIAYCLMPTHIHLILMQKSKNGIEKFMAKILNSYSRYFNTKHGRIGPLWSTRFKSLLIKDDEQLLHLTRYLHLNPTSAGLANKPEDWEYSSYKEYLDHSGCGLCNYDALINFQPKQYRKFVNDRKSYQRDLSIIKSLLFEDYAG